MKDKCPSRWAFQLIAMAMEIALRNHEFEGGEKCRRKCPGQNGGEWAVAFTNSFFTFLSDLTHLFGDPRRESETHVRRVRSVHDRQVSSKVEREGRSRAVESQAIAARRSNRVSPADYYIGISARSIRVFPFRDPGNST
ncbi:hypothetical protein [Calycomorphotria hydatis]|uniref:hypothetical protein n=1 Tax=Calycomorphotria hydatis TaxID=2528027 RepID=UPI0011AA9296|nr:hypothetical protein [Calycomorphotria hydatis]